MIDKWDMFAVDPPALNLNGREKISSFAGFISSIIVYILIMAYTISKVFDLIDGDPDVLNIKKIS